MAFADKYLQEHLLYQPQIQSEPIEGLGIVVVIPCYDEPDILKVLESLMKCEKPGCYTEVIIVVNSSENEAENVLLQNKATINSINKWDCNNNDEKIVFHIVDQPALPAKEAGVGLARKIGMDEALSRFNTLKKENGIIVCLDADSPVDDNYLIEIERQFINFPKTNACTIYFEHDLEGTEHPKAVYDSIIQYELYLRYYLHALRFAGFPYAFYTIGSCMAVRASLYAARGGMNRKQAGEDFYFLQKLIPLGHFYELNSTRVIPSPRPSHRIPFGTGPAIISLLENPILSTYNFEAFRDLKKFIEATHLFYKASRQEIEVIVSQLPESIRDFLLRDNFEETIREINANSSRPDTYTKRFYQWFNAFKILKFLNFSHECFYKREEVSEGACKLPCILAVAIDPPFDALQLLEILRGIDRKSTFRLIK